MKPPATGSSQEEHAFCAQWLVEASGPRDSTVTGAIINEKAVKQLQQVHYAQDMCALGS